jgi:hypothetical protein
MKTGKKIAVGLAATLVVAIFAAGAVSMVGAFEVPMPFVVVVTAGPDVTVTLGTGGVDFGSLLIGHDIMLSDSLVLTNTGDADAKVEAKFIPAVEGVHGLVNVASDEVIPASNLELGTTGNYVVLADNGDNVDLGEPNYVPAEGGTKNYNAKLTIPGGQSPDVYAGLIDITISAV